jgi:hypothetical protein
MGPESFMITGDDHVGMLFERDGDPLFAVSGQSDQFGLRRVGDERSVAGPSPAPASRPARDSPAKIQINLLTVRARWSPHSWSTAGSGEPYWAVWVISNNCS